MLCLFWDRYCFNTSRPLTHVLGLATFQSPARMFTLARLASGGVWLAGLHGAPSLWGPLVALKLCYHHCEIKNFWTRCFAFSFCSWPTISTQSWSCRQRNALECLACSLEQPHSWVSGRAPLHWLRLKSSQSWIRDNGYWGAVWLPHQAL